MDKYDAKHQLSETGIIRKNFAILKPNLMSKLNDNYILLEPSIQNCERKNMSWQCVCDGLNNHLSKTNKFGKIR